MTATVLADWWSWLPDLLGGLLRSALLSGTALAIGLPLGLLLALALQAAGRVAGVALAGLVELARGVPVLVLIYVAYFGLPSAGLTLSSFAAVVAAIAVSVGGFSAEVFRGGLRAVGRTQRDAARAVGLSTLDQYRRVILPQALRHAVPPVTGLAVQVVQLTALAFTVGYPELLARGSEIGTLEDRHLSVLTLSALLYLALLVPLTRFASRRTGTRGWSR
jgi:polar amino acid transport system permease protein